MLPEAAPPDACADLPAADVRSRSETAAHRELKRLSLVWAQAQGYRTAAAEVSLPNYRFRLDVAAYKPQRVRGTQYDERLKTQRLAWKSAIGLTAVFECKASRPDFRRDATSIPATLERLKMLQERRGRIEQELMLHYPSIRNGDSLFQEYQSVDFERPGHERYQRTMKEIGRLTTRLYGNTKFDRLVKWGAANLFYVVAEAGLMQMQAATGAARARLGGAALALGARALGRSAHRRRDHWR